MFLYLYCYVLFQFNLDEVLWHENYNLDNIVTPVNAEAFGKLLKEAGYPQNKIDFISRGFSEDFDLGYQGPSDVQMKSANLQLRIGKKTELWNKVMKEVAVNRMAGPFEKIPFECYIQSPIGLVPQDGGKKTRLIFHLSHPKKSKNGRLSVNAGIPQEKTSV